MKMVYLGEVILGVTIGKVYEIDRWNDLYNRIVDDNGQGNWIDSSNFVSIEDYRDKQIDELL
jgi:hypothetical protein